MKYHFHDSNGKVTKFIETDPEAAVEAARNLGGGKGKLFSVQEIEIPPSENPVPTEIEGRFKRPVSETDRPLVIMAAEFPTEAARRIIRSWPKGGIDFPLGM